MRTAPWLVLAFGLLLTIGCSREDQLHDVSGAVTFNNKPVPKGMVYFDPDPAAGGSGLQGFAPIENGRYDTAAGGRGISGGGYTIRVAGHDGKAANENPWGTALFDEYEFKKELPKEKSELNIAVPNKR